MKKSTKAPIVTVNPFESTLAHVTASAGIKGKRAHSIVRVLLQTGESSGVTPSGRYNRIARVAKTEGYKNPFAIARAVLPSWQVEALNAGK
jgi:hypothetical protein